jgi:NAD(P)-dependent dehydrogenase (short-subunit alcohol dehydrogenase family)
MQNYPDLKGKIALVTGASSGIGAATAVLLAQMGAKVAAGYFANQKGAQSVIDTITAAGGTAIPAPGDFRKLADIRQVVDQVTKQLGPIDILVNNAGSLVKRALLKDLTEELWDDVFALNVKSAVFASQAVAPGMIERRTGAIINVVSIAAHNGGGPGAGTYSSAKAAVISFTKSLAKELAPHGVRANAVSPGTIDTPFHQVFSTAEMIANTIKTIPLGRLGTSEECASVIAFLASDAARYVVGETIEINGGQLMR